MERENKNKHERTIKESKEPTKFKLLSNERKSTRRTKKLQTDKTELKKENIKLHMMNEEDKKNYEN